MEKLKEHKEKETVRLEAFSDGIFSVAITLLALEIGTFYIIDLNISPISIHLQQYY